MGEHLESDKPYQQIFNSIIPASWWLLGQSLVAEECEFGTYFYQLWSMKTMMFNLYNYNKYNNNIEKVTAGQDSTLHWPIAWFALNSPESLLTSTIFCTYMQCTLYVGFCLSLQNGFFEIVKGGIPVTDHGLKGPLTSTLKRQ